MAKSPKRMTVPRFTALKGGEERITMLTAYDDPIARLVDEAGIDAVLVGDTLGMVVQGKDSTLPVTLDEIIYHTEIVGRAVKRALVIADLPFPTFHLGEHKAIEFASRVLKETNAQAVKLEGGKQQAKTIAALVDAGIPVMAHCGLLPQTLHQMGGYKIQRDEDRLLTDAKAAADAGAFAMVLECIPAAISKAITEAVSIPTIGIGAGPDCDGQVLVTYDVLGLTSGYVPSFVRPYANLSETIHDALTRYRDDVRQGRFPGEDESFS